MSSSNRKPIVPNPTRWEPNLDPSRIEIPGLDTNASISDQIDQIDQLITHKLEKIDENFYNIKKILETQLLPAVKRYGAGTEPVREAAKFYTSFYEKASGISIKEAKAAASTLDKGLSEAHQTAASSVKEQSETLSDRTEHASECSAVVGLPPLEQRRWLDDSFDDSDSFDGLPPGMSPPQTISPARLPRSTSELGLITLGRLKPQVGEIIRDRIEHATNFNEVVRPPPPQTPRHDRWLDESFDGLPPGMSPPQTISPARPPRSYAELDLISLDRLSLHNTTTPTPQQYRPEPGKRTTPYVQEEKEDSLYGLPSDISPLETISLAIPPKQLVQGQHPFYDMSVLTPQPSGPLAATRAYTQEESGR